MDGSQDQPENGSIDRQSGRIDSSHELLNALDEKSLVFVGMMGSGKTAIGRMVANFLGLNFYDSDHEIVAAANLEIPEIFAQHGEAYFRAGEERVIQRLLSSGPAVISLGGGAFISEVTRAAVAQSAVSIWLQADLDLLMSRIMKRPGTRPLMQTADPRATLADLMHKREPIYALANVHVPSSRISKSATRDTVIEALIVHFAKNSG